VPVRVTPRRGHSYISRTTPDAARLRSKRVAFSLIGRRATRHLREKRSEFAPRGWRQPTISTAPPRPAISRQRPPLAGRRGLDPGTRCQRRGAFRALFDPPPVPIVVFCGNATPPKSKAKMAALAGQSGIDLRWVAGSLGLHEGCAQTIADQIARFVGTSPAEPTGQQRACRPVSAARL
jgi:hypothetical protein